MKETPDTNTRKKRSNGVSTNTLVVPLVVVLAFLFNLIVYAIYEVNRSTGDLSKMMNDYGNYQREATDMLGGSSLLSETSLSVVQTPVFDDGMVNYGPLVAYGNELSGERSGPKTLENFRTYNVGENVLNYMITASECYEYALKIQFHAIALIRSVYQFPPIPALSAIPEVALTAEELAMTNEERVDYAQQLMTSNDYGSNKSHIKTAIDNCNLALQEEFNAEAEKDEAHIYTMRTLLWVVTFTIIAILIVSFTVFYRWVVFPMRVYANLIKSDKSLMLKGGVKELRLVASAYNELLKRREKLEAFLRAEAETDSLTGMPNRYCFDRCLFDIAGKDGSTAIVLLDVNFLKHTNDTLGHLAGDKLICTAGKCICECFGVGKADNCYRIGGDEFAVLLYNCTEDDIKLKIDHFTLALERENISVSFGYAYAENNDENTLKAAMNLADKHMYEQKKEFHMNNQQPADR